MKSDPNAHKDLIWYREGPTPTADKRLCARCDKELRVGELEIFQQPIGGPLHHRFRSPA